VSPLAALIAIAIALAVGLVAGARMQGRNARPLTLAKEPDGAEMGAADEAVPPIPTPVNAPVEVEDALPATRDDGSERIVDHQCHCAHSLGRRKLILNPGLLACRSFGQLCRLDQVAVAQ